MCRKYLKELRLAKIDTIDTNSTWRERGLEGNVPLMYGEEYLGSEGWMALRINQDDREARQGAPPQIKKTTRGSGRRSRSRGESALGSR